MSVVNHFSGLKNTLILLTLLAGALIALPNVYGDDPAVQVKQPGAAAASAATADAARDRVTAILHGAALDATSVALEDGLMIARFKDTETQLKAVQVLRDALPEDWSAALNLAPRTPKWLRTLGLRPMSLGLDLRGGVHFLLQVDMKAATQQALERYESDSRSKLREKDVRYTAVAREGDAVVVRFKDADAFAAGRKLMVKEFPDATIDDVSTATEPALRVSLTEAQLRAIRDSAVQQNVVTLRNRVNEIGVAEPIVQQQGSERIVVQLPGIQDTVAARDILGATATLEFRLVSEEGNATEAESSGHVPANAKLYKDKVGRPVLLKREIIVRGDQLTDATSTFDQESGSPAVSVRLNSAGGRRMGDTTAANVGKPMAVVFIESKSTTHTGADGKPVIERKRTEQVISVATIRGVFSSQFQITGLEQNEAKQLSLLLRAGALAAPVDVVEERTIGPSLGQQNIEQGTRAAVIGFLLVVVVIGLYYKAFGWIANVAMVFNVLLLIALLSLLQATLTLPGIAGIVLTVGMAVDANVLIFERIREEVRAGKTPQAAIHSGYELAFATIADSNITTLIAGLVLFGLGSGPVKGFAITLCLGILTSVFSAVTVSRMMINFVFGNRRLTGLSV